MDSGTSSLISELQQSDLFAQCPHCHEEFKPGESMMFDGYEPFPPEAEAVRLEWERQLESKTEQLREQQVRADEGAEKRAIEIGIGTIIEKVLPAYKNFNLPPSDCRFLAEPIDMIVFNGASDLNVDHITFMEVKTGKANLNKHQRQIRDAVKDNQVKFEVV